MSAPYLTTRPNDGIMTGGGRLKLALRISPGLLPMALTSAGVGSLGARFSLKNRDSKKISIMIGSDI